MSVRPVVEVERTVLPTGMWATVEQLVLPIGTSGEAAEKRRH
jgi:hypothetical protein